MQRSQTGDTAAHAKMEYQKALIDAWQISRLLRDPSLPVGTLFYKHYRKRAETKQGLKYYFYKDPFIYAHRKETYIRKAQRPQKVKLYIRRNLLEDKRRSAEQRVRQHRLRVKRLYGKQFDFDGFEREVRTLCEHLQYSRQRHTQWMLERDAYCTMSVNDDLVRSRAEALMISLMVEVGLLYEYESKLTLRNGGTYYPDFKIRRPDGRTVYIEYFGMMGDPEYAERQQQKLAAYQDAGIVPGVNLICFCSSAPSVINTYRIMDVLLQLSLHGSVPDKCVWIDRLDTCPAGQAGRS